jgi:carbamoyl-phosphate synthase large subunit
VTSPEAYAGALAIVPDPIVQEFVAAPEVTTDVVCAPDGAVLAVVSRQRLEVRSGEVLKGVTVRHDGIIDGCQRVARALDARGPITVQCFLTAEGPLFLEVNARLGGGFPLGLAAGADSLAWLLARAAGLPAAVPPIGTYRTNVYMTRFDQSFFLEHEPADDARRLSV